MGYITDIGLSIWWLCYKDHQQLPTRNYQNRKQEHLQRTPEHLVPISFVGKTEHTGRAVLGETGVDDSKDDKVTS